MSPVSLVFQTIVTWDWSQKLKNYEWMNEWKVYSLKLYNFCEWEQWLSCKFSNARLLSTVHVNKNVKVNG